jgi:hypothetical protein
MKSPKPTLPPNSTKHSSGGVARDNKDQAATEVGLDDIALNPDVDTIRLVALEYNDKLSLEDSGTDTVLAPFDPYNNSGNKSLDNKPRKSIDDLRKLSAEITKAKRPPPKRK